MEIDRMASEIARRYGHCFCGFGKHGWEDNLNGLGEGGEDWSTHEYIFREGDLKISNSQSNVGEDDIYIDHKRKTVYIYTSDGIEGEVERDEEGEWKEEFERLYAKKFPLRAKRLKL